MNSGRYNPYEDPTLSQIKSEEKPSLSDREPFNDAVRHTDIINGYQSNKILSHYPRRILPWIRFGALVALLLFLMTMIFQFVHL